VEFHETFHPVSLQAIGNQHYSMKRFTFCQKGLFSEFVSRFSRLRAAFCVAILPQDCNALGGHPGVMKERTKELLWD
jgi:hypothetical protein